MSELLKCTSLTKNYGHIAALKNVDLVVEGGKIIGLLGPNGSGKTTLIKLINGLLVPDGGEITILGNKPGVESKLSVAYLPDNDYLNPSMTALATAELFADFYPDFSIEAAKKMFGELGIDQNAKLKTLSKGNREKVCLILTMSRKAKLYVLDEPIAGVDPATRDYIISTILQNYNKEASVIISTHIISDIESALDEVIFLKGGEIVLHKSVDEIRNENNKSVDELFREVFKW
ncbi:MAG: ABC transporter ATP-binding protein [Clostridia bacterium]|nr:ABC transporter ATP-binding protein [Clostridia bacterium]